MNVGEILKKYINQVTSGDPCSECGEKGCGREVFFHDLNGIVRYYLKVVDADGIANPCTGCACWDEDYLRPCGFFEASCRPAKKSNPEDPRSQETDNGDHYRIMTPEELKDGEGDLMWC